MRKAWAAIAALAVLLVLPGTALAEGEYYEDAETGVRFAVPEGWTEEDPDDETGFVVYSTALEEGGDYYDITFGYLDLWEGVPESARDGLTRSDVDNSIFSEADFEEEYGLGTVTTVTYNQTEYYKLNLPDQTVTRGSFTVTIHVIMFIYVQDGIEYMFGYGWYADTNNHYDDFEALIRSVEYPPLLTPSEASGSSGAKPSASYTPEREPTRTYSASPAFSGSYTDDLNAGAIVLSLIVTIAVYSLPVVIYRYGIRKRPMEPKPARRLTIIWAVIGFILLSLIAFAMGGSEGATGGGIVLWSYVNYRMLTGGADKRGEGEANFDTQCYPNGSPRYRGHFRGDLYDGSGTLYNARGEAIYWGMFSEGFIDEPHDARAQRLDIFKQTCAEPVMQELYRDAQAGAGTHVRLNGRVFRSNGDLAGEYSFFMYFQEIPQPDALLCINYHISRGEMKVFAGQRVTVWGSVESLVPYDTGAGRIMVPLIEAWSVE